MTIEPAALTPDSLSLVRLLQLASPTLPIGAYAYSQGLEWAIEQGWVRDEATLTAWLTSLLEEALACLDVPLLARLHAAWQRHDPAGLRRWNNRLHAYRETAELRADDRDRGQALARLLRDLGWSEVSPWCTEPRATLATLFAFAAWRWHSPLVPAACAYVWGWLENQVLAAIKLVPLGQVAGQRVLFALGALIPAVVAGGLALDDADIGGTSPALAIASSLHETQYTRLFRS